MTVVMTTTTESAWAKTRQHLKQAVCWLSGGHDELLNFEDQRMRLRCTSCGHAGKGVSWVYDARFPETYSSEAKSIRS